MEGSLYNNVIGQEEKNYTQLSQDALAYLIAYTSLLEKIYLTQLC